MDGDIGTRVWGLGTGERGAKDLGTLSIVSFFIYLESNALFCIHFGDRNPP